MIVHLFGLVAGHSYLVKLAHVLEEGGTLRL